MEVVHTTGRFTFKGSTKSNKLLYKWLWYCENTRIFLERTMINSQHKVILF